MYTSEGVKKFQWLSFNSKLHKDEVQQKENLTILLIAHRLSTVQNADQIIVIDKGNVVETGKHSELMAKKNYYYNLVSRQVSTKEDLQSLSEE